MNNRIVVLNVYHGKCELVIEVAGLGCSELIDIDSEEAEELLALKRELAQHELRDQNIELQNEIIKRFREIQEGQETSYSIYAERDNYSDYG